MNKKIIISGFVSLFTVLAASSARADEPQVAPAAPVATAPSASPDKPAPAVAKDPDEPRTGFALRLELPIVAPQGSIAKGVDAFGPGVGIGGYAGYYVTPNVGLFVGAQASFGHSENNCSGCKGSTLELPVYVEAAQSKYSGFYGQFGVAFLPTAALTDNTGATASFQSTADLKVGLGYRISQRQLTSSTNGSMFAFSVFTALSAGQYTDVKLTDASNNDASGKVDSAKLDYHFTATAGVGVAFLP